MNRDQYAAVGGAYLFTEPNGRVGLAQQREQALGQQITELFSSSPVRAGVTGCTQAAWPGRLHGSSRLAASRAKKNQSSL